MQASVIPMQIYQSCFFLAILIAQNDDKSATIILEGGWDGKKQRKIMLHKIYVRINCVRYGGEKVFRDVAYMTTKGENPCQGWCFNNPDR